MSILADNYDSIEQMIFKNGIKIVAVDVHPQLNTFYVILSSTITIQQRIDKYALLKGGSEQALKNVEICANGTAIHWPDLDEDLSLKGLLVDHLLMSIFPAGETNAFAA
jgi:hypothetical protein